MKQNNYDDSNEGLHRLAGSKSLSLMDAKRCVRDDRCAPISSASILHEKHPKV
jgi:hypothetical protein